MFLWPSQNIWTFNKDGLNNSVLLLDWCGLNLIYVILFAFLGNRMNRTQNIPDELATEMKAKISYDLLAYALGSR